MSTIETKDGILLEARLWKPSQPKGLAIIQGGIAIPQRYYAAFAEWLSERGWAVVTFDYRGIGASKKGHARDVRTSLSTWAETDVPAIHEWAEREVPGVPLAIVGHSFGGQIVGLHANPRVRATLLVGGQSGHWRSWDGSKRLAVGVVWHVLMPLFVKTFGYVPAWAGMGEDLPGGAAEEWARWGRDPDYLFGHKLHAREAFSAYPGQIKSLSITDDGYAPPRGVRALADRFPPARHTFETVDPGAFELAQIGHFGWFRQSNKALWPSAAQWMEEQI